MPTKVELMETIDDLKSQLLIIEELKNNQTKEYIIHVEEHTKYIDGLNEDMEKLSKHIFSLTLTCKFLLSVTTMLIGSIIGYVIYQLL